jgi:hypothetical protein
MATTGEVKALHAKNRASTPQAGTTGRLRSGVTRTSVGEHYAKIKADRIAKIGK